MPRETQAQRAARAVAVLDALDAAMPGATIELHHRTPLELLVAVLLSAQTTDVRVNLVTPALFARFPTAEAYAQATPAEVEPFIRTVGLFRNKARALVALGQQLVAQHEGQVPTARAVLAELPGVGPKTAGVVSMHLGGDFAFPVDTHVFRLAHRLGFSKGPTPEAVEADLQALLPKGRWLLGHQLLVWHGRRTCLARKPACERCAVQARCPSAGRA